MPARPTALLTLGRLPKALDIARALHGSGWRVLVAEPYGWNLTGTSRSVARSVRVTAPAADRQRYLAELVALVHAEQVQLVVPVSEETMHVAFLHGRLPAGVRLATVPPAALLRLHSKLGFAQAAAALGLPVPETWPLGSAGAAALAARQDVVVKPEFSCSGRGLRRIARGQPLPPADADQPAVVQATVRGQELSTCSIAHQGQLLGTVVYRGALMAGSVAVVFERVAPSPALADWLARFVAGCGHSGFISFDLIVDDAGQPWPIECNPRATSGVHFFEPADLARALTAPQATLATLAQQPLRHRPQPRLQQFYSTLTELQGAMFRRGYGARLRALLGTPDVSWQRRDPWPFVLMTGTSWPIIRAAMRSGVPFGEVATLDVGWTAAHQRDWLAEQAGMAGPAQVGDTARP
jgi:hypothetical protein